jgi:hypothetical protein
MGFWISVAVIYVISLALFYIFMKKEKQTAGAVGRASVFALLPTLFMIPMFQLTMSLHHLLIMSAAFAFYVLFVDDLVMMIGRYLSDHDRLKYVFAAVFRFGYLYMLGFFLSVGTSNNLKFAIGLTGLYVLLEMLFARLKERNAESHG